MAAGAPADQLWALQKENEKLQQALAARDQEIAALREIAEAASQLQSQDTQAAKVIELSKKNRALNLALEREKQRVAQLQQTLSEAAHGREGFAVGGTPASKLQAAARSAVEQAAEAADSAAKEASVWRERAQQQTNKMSQLEQKVFALDAENKKLSRALAREVGEDVPLAKVLEEGGDWKGRRETIIALRDTVRKLREEKGAPAPSKHDEAHRNLIGKAAKERAAEAERLASELAASKAATEQLRRQYAGASSRRKVLEDELAAIKDKMGVVLRKTKNDDRLITALRAELAAAVQGGGGGGRHIRASVTGVGSPSGGRDPAWTEVAQLHQQVLEQDEQLEQSAKVIRYLQAQLQQGGGGGSRGAGGPGKEDLLMEQLEATQDECDELRGQVRALQDDLEQLQSERPGTSGLSSDLRQQVQALQEENERLRGGLAAQHEQQQEQQQQPRRTGSGSRRSVPSGGSSRAETLVVEHAGSPRGKDG